MHPAAHGGLGALVEGSRPDQAVTFRRSKSSSLVTMANVHVAY